MANLGSRKRRLLVGCGVLMAVAAGAAFNLVGFWGSAVCQRCGMQSHYREWHWGHDGPRLVTISKDEQETGLSQFVKANGLSKDCPHAWCFASGGNYPVIRFAKSCALGRGVGLRSTVNNTDVTTFLEEHQRRGDTNTVKLWLGRLLNPKSSRNALWSITTYDVSEGSEAERLAAADAEFIDRQSAEPQ